MVDIFKQLVTTVQARNAVKEAQAIAAAMAKHCDGRIAEKDALLAKAREALEVLAAPDTPWPGPNETIARQALAEIDEAMKGAAK